LLLGRNRCGYLMRESRNVIEHWLTFFLKNEK
jgi:hypothetical protein